MNTKIDFNGVVLSKYARFIVNNDYVILGNIAIDGRWIKLEKKLYNFLYSYIKQDNGCSLLLNSLDNEEERIFYQDLLVSLAKIRVITKKDITASKINSISVELTTECNLRCKHCDSSYGDISKKELSIDEIKKVIKFANERGAELIILSGGEIFCRKDINGILKLFGEYFNGEIELLTNATLLTTDNIKSIDNYVDMVSISLDGYDEKSTDFIRGTGTFKKTIENIKILQNNGFEQISLSMIMSSDNKKNSSKFKELCKELNVKPITRDLNISGRSKDNLNVLLDERDLHINSKVSMLCTCNAGEEMISISSEGIVSPCAALDYSKYSSYQKVDDFEGFSHELKYGIIDDVLDCNTCIVKYFCATACHAKNISVYFDEEIKRIWCLNNKERLIMEIWGEENE